MGNNQTSEKPSPAEKIKKERELRRQKRKFTFFLEPKNEKVSIDFSDSTRSNFLSLLPRDLIFKDILPLLSCADLFCLSVTCRAWKDFIDPNDPLWLSVASPDVSQIRKHAQNLIDTKVCPNLMQACIYLSVFISPQVVALHNTPESLWIIISGAVYDVTKFVDEHPGGREILMEKIGTGEDAGNDFDEIMHSNEAKKLLDDFYIGEVYSKI